MQYTSVYLHNLPRHYRHSTGLHSNPALFKQNVYSTISWFPPSTSWNILQTFILQRKGDVALLACDYSQSEIRIVLNMLTNNSQFLSKQWMTQRQCVYELPYWHNTQLICVNRVKNSWMIISISSFVRISLIQLNAIVTYCTEWHLRDISCLLFHCCVCI